MKNTLHSFAEFFFFFNDTATTEIYTLSLHDALPISLPHPHWRGGGRQGDLLLGEDRKSTRLNSSHVESSYAVFCLKKKKSTLHDCRRNKNKKHTQHRRRLLSNN